MVVHADEPINFLLALMQASGESDNVYRNQKRKNGQVSEIQFF